MALSVTNTSNRVQSFSTNTGARVHVEPGDTKSIALDRDNPYLVAKERAGFVSVKDAPSKAAEKAETKQEQASDE